MSAQAFGIQSVFVAHWVTDMSSMCGVVHLLSAMPCAWHSKPNIDLPEGPKDKHHMFMAFR